MRNWEHCLLAILLGAFFCTLYWAGNADGRRSVLQPHQAVAAPQEVKAKPASSWEIAQLQKSIKILNVRVDGLEERMDDLESLMLLILSGA